MHSKRAFLLLCSLVVLAAASMAWAGDYAVVVTRKTAADPAWQQVVAALVAAHHADVIAYDGDVTATLPALRKQFPRYVCFVAQPDEAGRDFVAQVHRQIRKLGDDPYADCFWGILTGYDADAALRIARHQDPLVIHKAAAGTEIALDMCDQGIWYCELDPTRAQKKEPGSAPGALQRTADSTEALAGLLTDYHADLFITSGHASERDWMIGYRYRNGYFRCENGVVYGLNTKQEKFPIHSDNPKVYLPVGNCLMGHVNGRDCMALAYMNSAGVNQMTGYTVESWYGYAGWGMLDYFVEQPGRYTCAEAFAASEAALIHRLATYFPELLNVEDGVDYRGPVTVSDAAKAAGLTEQDGRGLLYDRDVFAFYGDPAWSAKMADHPTAWDQTLSEHDGVYSFDIKPNRGAASFDPINTNGAQRGHRPMIQFFDHRLSDIQLIDGGDLKPVITGQFILIPNPGTCDPIKPYHVTFQAKAAR
jgi:zinc protease